jgi:hypothetical protein
MTNSFGIRAHQNQVVQDFQEDLKLINIWPMLVLDQVRILDCIPYWSRVRRIRKDQTRCLSKVRRRLFIQQWQSFVFKIYDISEEQYFKWVIQRRKWKFNLWNAFILWRIQPPRQPEYGMTLTNARHQQHQAELKLKLYRCWTRKPGHSAGLKKRWACRRSAAPCISEPDLSVGILANYEG